MNTLKNIVAAVVVSIVAAIGVVHFTKSPTPLAPKLGAVATLDNVNNPFVTINGLRQYYYSAPVTATSSTFCFIKNPLGATSTILSLSTIFSSTTAFTTTGGGANQSVQYSISTSTTLNTAGNSGSSSPSIVRDHGILAAASTDDMYWIPGAGTTTQLYANAVLPTASTSGETNIKIYPNQYLVWKWATTTQPLAPTFTYWPQGKCGAILQAL